MTSAHKHHSSNGGGNFLMAERHLIEETDPTFISEYLLQKVTLYPPCKRRECEAELRCSVESFCS